MSARRLMHENWFMEEAMKVDLTPREIEVLLILMNEAASGDFTLDGPPIYSTEELSIVKKLEAALEHGEKHRKKNPSHVSHSKH